jgi:hypothetical protein
MACTGLNDWRWRLVTRYRAVSSWRKFGCTIWRHSNGAWHEPKDGSRSRQSYFDQRQHQPIRRRLTLASPEPRCLTLFVERRLIERALELSDHCSSVDSFHPIRPNLDGVWRCSRDLVGWDAISSFKSMAYEVLPMNSSHVARHLSGSRARSPLRARMLCAAVDHGSFGATPSPAERGGGPGRGRH